MRTRGKCRKHEPQTRVFFISRGTRLRLLHLLHDIDFTCRELKQQSTQIDKLTQFNITKVLHASSSKLSAASQRPPSQISLKNLFSPSLTKMLTRGNVAKNNITRFSYVLYPDKTWVFDQSERAQGPIYIIN